EGPDRGDLPDRRRRGEEQPRGRADAAASDGAGGRRLRPRHRPPRPRPAIRDRLHQAARGARLGPGLTGLRRRPRRDRRLVPGERGLVAPAEGRDRGEVHAGGPVTALPVVHETPIPGLLVVDLPVHGDARGWFKENWQREKVLAAGLPDFGPVQNNISFNQAPGVTRGIHAEPWDKYISVATGRVFGAWVDLREGDSFGA